MKQIEDRAYYVAEFVMPLLSYVPTILISLVYIALNGENSGIHILFITLLIGTFLIISVLRADIILMLRMPGYVRNYIVSTIKLTALLIALIAKHVLYLQYLITAVWLLIIPALLLWAWLMSYGKTAMNVKNQFRKLRSNNRLRSDVAPPGV